MTTLLSYPVATFSALLTYSLLFLFLVPGFGPRLRGLFAHPIPATQHYLMAFDTLRGFAALLVAVGHLWYFSYPATAPIQLDLPFVAYGAKAVPMFAMLSGFLIYRSIRDADSFENIRYYLYRRFFRIYPLYVVSVLGMLAIGQTATARGDYGTFNYVVAELFLFRILDAPFFSNPATWSLYVEVSFYIFMPIYVMMVPKRHMLTITALLALSLTIADQWHAREFYMWKYFAFGIIASELSLKYRVKPWLGAGLFALGVLWLALDMQGPRYDLFTKLGIVAHNQSEYTLGLGLACSLILFGIGYVGPIARALNVFPLRWIGIVSYSLFLLHPFYIVANFPQTVFYQPVATELLKTFPVMPSWYFAGVYVPGVFIWAAVGFLLVERPGLMFGRAWLKKRQIAGGPQSAALAESAKT